MAETYCGKSCINCSVKEEMNCPGCMNGPGMPIKGDCPIAICCRDKGHNECSTCGLKGECTNLKSRGNQPEFRKDKLAAEAEEQEYIYEYAPVLGKKYDLIFLLMLIANAAFIFTSNSIQATFPGFYLGCCYVTAAFTLLYALVLFRISKIHESFMIAGICALINTIYHFTNAFAFKGNTPAWFVLFNIVVYIAMIVEGYHFFSASSDTLEGVDDILSAKWADLWKWYKWCMIGMISSVFILFLIPIIGALILIASLIGTIITDIIKFVYIYNTGKAFRKYASSIKTEE